MTTTPATPPPTIGSGHEGSARDQISAYFRTVRQGEMGALPAIGGFVVLAILFSFLSSSFLTPLNLANLLTQSATLMTLAMALVFVILLGEIDLSAGVTSGVTAAIFVVLVHNFQVPWLLALAAAFAAGLAIGTFIGFFVARVGIPSFVVTLGLFLGFQGLQLVIIGTGGAYRIETPEIAAIMNKNLPIPVGWVLYGVAIALAVGIALWDRARRTRAGVANRPLILMWGRLVAIAIAGALFVAFMSIDRAASRGTLNGVEIPHDAIEGVPIVVPIAVGLLWIGTFVLDRTRYGRHLYAVGGNTEAARRAGIKVAAIRMSAFIVCSTLAVVAGLFDASRIGVVTASSGSQIVLSGVAAAVVGGVSLFGGRGRLVHAAIGALVIAVIANGLGLLGLPAGINFLVTGGVLILAATIDALSRKRAGGTLIR
ncbi:sugar ABC transporter permease [Salinibacterium soli]|uniref:Xylose transport system permease protein XylH n=1 Tax=Antiquaquibacter soli TaxID=3064523 RepID=A0ABT9BIX8_9MICO|nr:ABC transporter permease [Protaetiibacter sp. WY-16]MDO7880979.1 ABC transporter permease [Protaetiibacter sp. WY-16]